MKVPAGFRFSGIHSGIKGARKDLALVYSESPCTTAGVFTVNASRAAPVLDAEKRVPSSDMRALLINSGNANALTGEAGLQDVELLKRELAIALGIDPATVLTASTGVIGHRMPAAKISAAFPSLVRQLKSRPEPAAEAIMTTDTREKLASRTVRLGFKNVHLAAIAKGSGMIAPEMATMIAVIVTDAVISPELLSDALKRAVNGSFNALMVDGDMSTNDCAIAMANGKAANAPMEAGSKGYESFCTALTDLCQELAREVATDGEGATKLLTVKIQGAPTQPIAQELARTVAGSTLVKAAVFGADPNWGRILASLGGRIGSRKYAIDPHKARVSVQDIIVYDAGPTTVDLSVLRAKMREPEVDVDVDLRAGDGAATSWGCDLSYDYVKINADYSSLIVATPDGGVAKDNRLTNYSPGFKTALLVEALSYISSFAGKRCVIMAAGPALVKDSLKKTLCDDINLLRTVGLAPVLVHGGGPEMVQTFARFGGKNRDWDVDIAGADPRVVEMVLSGSVNSELVTLLNQEGGHAVGLSGKDGALLRARRREGDPLTHSFGEITRVNKEFLEMLLSQNYIPVVSPIGIGEDGSSLNLDAASVASEVAMTLKVNKLIYLGDVPGIVRNGEVIPEISAATLEEELRGDSLSPSVKRMSASILRAVRSGIERVHLIDGRVPHSVIAELFTDRGVGTLVTA